ncbi:hemagglutinin repeat-containing protein [Comamonas sp. GB3 AK4-5]|uniref:hemagglutinin repeat-containing protein n=1 Tax=Comamonas sp. GB3 AK4-5 TaxID=3231487 RepID=UPI00351EF7DA
MNKNLHRVIFNKSRGIRMVVQETASSVGKASSGHTQTGSAPSELFAAATGLGGLVLKPLAVAAALLLGSHTSLAQIIADPSAPGRQRPTVLESANGTPTVNIQTPSAAGVSRNTYQQFDIGQKGAILNNSRTDVQTQLGGWIQGNAGLANGSAKVIVNEVNSAAQSKLMGALEVAGQRADVIIANPSGLVVDGLSFINAAGVTLSTGRLLYGVNGSVDGFNIQGGQIGFQGSGMDATKADYATILARAISVNAGLWAKDLRVATGVNQTDASGNVQQRHSSEGMDASQKPKFALDVAQLGGMYAGKIFIVGTEAGLGVRNAGTLAAQGEGLLLQTDGTLLNVGKVQASTSLTIQARDSVQNASADAAIISGTDLSITAAAVDAKHGSLMAAGVDAQGNVGQNGNLLLAAATSIDLQGQIVAAGAAELQAGQVALVGADLSAKSARISASRGDLNASGASINVLDTFEGSASGQLRTSGGKVVADHLVLQATSLNNAGGVLLQTGVNDMSLHLAQSLDNSAGTISTNAKNLSIQAGQLSNAAGQITHAGSGTLAIAIDGALDSRQGVIQSQGAAELRVADANLDKAKLDAQQLNFEAASLTTQGAQIIQRGQLLGRVAVFGDWNNTNGLVWFNADASFSAGALANLGGQLAATQSLALAVDGRLVNQHGSIAAGKDITASVGSLENSSGAIGTQQGNLHLTSRKEIVNDSGVLQASAGVQIRSQGLRNGKASGAADGGAISGTTVVLDMDGTLLDNALGTIAATDALTIHAGDLSNQQGFISTGGALAIDAHALSNTSGKIGSADSLSVTADSLDNSGGQIQSQGGQTLHVDQALTNTEGLIRSGDALALQAASITNTTTSGVDQGIEGNAVTLKTALLNNEHGAIRAGDAIVLQSSGVLLNSQGLISATGNVALLDDSSTKSLAIDNTQATVIAGQRLEVGAKSLTGNGQMLSHGDIDISLTTDFVNTSAVIANRDLTLRTTADVSNTGQLQAGSNLALSASNLSNALGAEVKATNTHLKVQNSFTNRGLVDGETARIDAGSLLNLGRGRLYGDTLSIQATEIVNGAEAGTAASIAARSRLDIGSVSLVNSEQALIFSAGDATIGGALNADGTATGSADTITNSGASIEAVGNLQLTAKNIENLNSNFSLATGTTVSESKHEILLNYLTERLDYGKVYFYGQKENDSYIGATMASHVERSDGEHIYMAMGDCWCLVPGPFSADWQEYSYTRYTTTDVVASSAPGRITSGGNLVVRGGLVNDKSQVIAGQILDVSGASVKNIDAVGTRTIIDKGSVRAHTYGRGHAHGVDWWLDWLGYDPGAQVENVNLSVTSFLGNTAGAVSGSIAAPSQVTPVSAVVSTTGTPVVNVKGNVQQVNLQGPSSGSGAHTVIRTTQPNTAVPASSLYHAAASTAGYLIETDPQFTNRGKWLGSDYLLSALNQDPALLQKRLGDGFYEQRLVREQVAELTGRRFIDGYANDEAQYQALMQSGVTFARKWDLIPGVALSAEQMAQLTSDIVWLVEKTVVLPDGSTTSALVPQVYMRVQEGDLDGTGTLLAGAQVNIKAEGGLLNTGTIAGRQAVVLDAHNVQNLAGRITGGTVAISAALDVDNIGARIDADKALNIQAGRDINLVTTTTEVSNTVGSAAYSRKTIDRVAGLYVTGADAALQAKAGRDLNLQGAEIINGSLASDAPSGGTTILSAERDANFTTVQTAQSQSLVWDAGNYQKRAGSTEIGTQVQGAGAVTISAGHDVNTRAAQVTAGSELQLAAGNNLNITAGEATSSHDFASKETKSGLLGKKTYVYQSTSNSNTAVSSTLSGGTVQMQAGKDIAVTGSNVVSDTGTTLVAGNDVTIQAATETHHSTHYQETRKSGVFGSGGMGFTIGKQQQSTDQAGKQTTAAASTVGAVNGDVNIVAGNQYRQVGSDVVAPQGDVNVLAKDIAITEARETSGSSTETRFKQSGVSVSISSPVISAVQTADNMAKAASNTSSGRMQALAAAATALNVYNSADDLKGAAQGLANGDVSKGVSVSISLGTSKSQSTSTQSSDGARGSTVVAGGNVNLVAQGAGQDSDILIRGSDISAGKDAALKAEGDIRLQAAQNQASLGGSNSSSSGSIGISVGAQTGITVSASKGRGNEAGDDLIHSNTHITAGNKVSLQSGADTTLQGAVVKGESVKADVGGNLHIESLQDSSTYASQNKSMGGSITFSPAGVPTGGGINASKSKVNSDYQSVTEQSGIKAGDGGFDVKVKGDTDLKGAVIASNQAAVEQEKNRFSTGGELTTSDLHNSAHYEGKAVGVNASVGNDDGKFGVKGVGAGVGKDSGSADSTTTAGISGMAGDTAVRSTDAETGIQRIFDKEKVQKDIDAQVAITAEFGKQASKAIGDYAQIQTQEAKRLLEQAKGESDPQRRAELEAQAKQLNDAWGDNGTLRLLAHTVVGGLTGGASGAAGAALGTVTAPAVADALSQAGITGTLADVLTATASTAAGAVAGGTSGAAAAGNEVVNNYLNHNRPSMLRLSEKERYENAYEACSKGDPAGCKEKESLAQLSLTRDRDLAQACGNGNSDYCHQKAKEAILMGNIVIGATGSFVYANSLEYGPIRYLNTETIGEVASLNSFHEKLAKSTSEAILLEMGNQVVAGALKGAELISLAVARQWEASKILTAEGVFTSAAGNISAQKITQSGVPAFLNESEILSLRTINNLDKDAGGALREVVADQYFKRNGFTALNGKCGVNCFDGVYIRGDQVVINEVKPLSSKNTIKLNDNAKSSNNIDVQMSDNWIASRVVELRASGDSAKIFAADTIEKAMMEGKLVKIVSGVNENGMTFVKLGR